MVVCISCHLLLDINVVILARNLMEGVAMLTCLVQHTLRACCSSQDTKWVYAVFWRILPRLYPPPKWDCSEVLDPAKGNKRNWILVWEDGFCDVDECDNKARFGPNIFFKLSHEVYNYGEGLIGKVAADNTHRWVFKDDPNFNSSSSIDPQPRAWDFHFNSGIKTIALISVREGVIQLGSFHKILQDVNLVISIQRKFSYLRSIPGLFPIQRPISTHNLLKHKMSGSDEAKNVNGGENQLHKGPIWSFSSGYNTQQNGRMGSLAPPLWPIPPLLPYNFRSNLDPTRICNGGVSECLADKISRVKDPDQDRKPGCFHPNPGLVVELGFGPKRVAQ